MDNIVNLACLFIVIVIMILIADLNNKATERLADATVLLNNGRFEGAIYICGYAMEFALKAKICGTLNWLGYPETKNEFGEYGSFKTHKLAPLLHLSGREDFIKQNNLSEWSQVSTWNPEMRYSTNSVTYNQQSVQGMITSVTTLINVL